MSDETSPESLKGEVVGEVHEFPNDGWSIEDVVEPAREQVLVVLKPQANGRIMGLVPSNE